MTRYRDSRTGKFVSKSTWTRSRAQDGTRYKQERLKPTRRVRLLRPAARPSKKERERAIEEEIEYTGAIDYDTKRKK